MKKNKKLNKLSILGYLILLLGLIFIMIPLVNRTYNQIISNKRLDDFYQEQLKRTSEDIEKENKQIEKYNELVSNSESTSTDPFIENENEASFNYLEDKNDIFGYLIIPKIEKRLPIYLGASMENMEKGVGQLAGTHIPVGGKNTRSVIAGHRGWWGDTMFLYVDELEKGDYVYVERANKTLRYKVDSKEVISKYDWEKLDPIKDKDMLTLLTCMPFGTVGTDEKRFLVNTISDEEYNNPKKTEDKDNKTTNLNNLVQSENQNNEMPFLVKIFNIGMMIAAAIAMLSFIYILIRFIKRIRMTFN